MPAKQADNSGEFAKLMGQSIIDAHKEASVTPSSLKFGGQLPAGIENGIGRLRSLTIGKYAADVADTNKRGKPYFMGQAEAIEPVELHGQKVKGIIFKVGPEPLFDTPEKKSDTSRKTFAQHYKFMYDHLKQLGMRELADVSKLKPDMVEEYLRKEMKRLSEEGPCFRYRTWEGQCVIAEKDSKGHFRCYQIKRNPSTHEWDKSTKTPLAGAKHGPFKTEQEIKAAGVYVGEPMVNVVWMELCDAPTVKPQMQDNSEDAGEYSPTPSDNGASRDTIPFDEFAGQQGDNTENDANEDTNDTNDVDVLVEAANPDGQNDGAAQNKLEELAVANGYSSEEVADAPNWEAVGEMARSPKAGGVATAEAATPAPAKDDMVKYSTPDKKKKGVMREVDCQVVSVDKKRGTCKLKAMDKAGTVYENVPFAEIK